MQEEDTRDLDRFEQLLEEGMVKICSGAGLLPDELVRCPDIDSVWDVYIKDYIADAVVNFNEYPEAALAWAGFLGLGVAWAWDADWQRYKDRPYRKWYGARGWDDMDEHILRDVLGLPLDSPRQRRFPIPCRAAPSPCSACCSTRASRRRPPAASTCSPAPIRSCTAPAPPSSSTGWGTRKS